MDAALLKRFDGELKAAGYTCRSEALRDLVLGWLACRSLSRKRGTAVGVLSFVYDHNRHNLSHRLVHLQHKHLARVIATMHVHLDSSSCLEVVILRGQAEELRRLADRLTAIKSVQQGSLALIAEPTSAVKTVPTNQEQTLRSCSNGHRTRPAARVSTISEHGG